MSYEPQSPSAAAQHMLERCWDRRLPVDPFVIAERNGLRVERLSASSPYSGWYDAAGMTIYYKGDEAAVRQRFTVAHELGHYALGHGDSPRDTAVHFSARALDYRERLANQFAAELLMPEEAVQQIVASGRYSSLDELARLFHVSKVAMSYRISNLGVRFFA